MRCSLLGLTLSILFQWVAADEPPMQFIANDLPEKRLVQHPDWRPWLFKNDEALEDEAQDMMSIFGSELSQRSFLSCEGRERAAWKVPLQVVTSGEGEKLPWQSFVNGTRLNEVAVARHAESDLASSFNLVDLFAA